MLQAEITPGDLRLMSDEIANLAPNHPPSSSDPTHRNAIELTIVVPTFNERSNIRALVAKLDAALQDTSWEVIFVDDDSPDGTFREIVELGRSDARVRGLRRIGRRGLSSACIEGMLASSAPYYAVMDADLQHDESILPRMLAVLRNGQADLAIGSRYTEGGGVGDWSRKRKRMSRFASRLAGLALRTPVGDPMSGFFMLRRDVLDQCVYKLSGIGFKILLDILSSTRKPLRVAEIPYQFRNRQFGESKLDNAAVYEYLLLLLDKWMGRFIPARFIAFSLVGGLGVFAHMGVLWGLFQLARVEFVTSQAAATLAAMTFNFWLNNLFTYRDRQLRGWKWFQGLFSFAVVCSVGAVANVGIAAYLFAEQHTRWMLAALAGILVSAVWNYAVSSVFTWNARKSA